jgi:hypothetical protein
MNAQVTKPRPGEQVAVRVKNLDAVYIYPDLAKFFRSKWLNARTDEEIPLQVWSWRTPDTDDSATIDTDTYRKYVKNAPADDAGRDEVSSSSAIRMSDAARQKLEALMRPPEPPPPQPVPVVVAPRRPTVMRVSISAMLGVRRGRDHWTGVPSWSDAARFSEAQVVRTGYRPRTMR